MIYSRGMNDKLKIIGLAGTNGAGKDAVGELLADRHGYFFYSLTELLREECRLRGIPITRENTRMISSEWRRESGNLAVLIDRSMDVFEQAGGFAKYKGFVMSSYRNPGEVDRLHELGGSLLWVDADARLRYDRIQKYADARNRAAEDNKTFEQFQQEEYDEMHPPAGADAAVLNIAAVKERADISISNNGDTLDSLDEALIAALKLKKS
jgi:dephospho-CoA kinase